MQVKAEAIFDLWSDDDRHLNKIVREYREQYKAIGRILDKSPEILAMVHRDLDKLSKATSRRGRKPLFTSENLFRPILVMQREGLDYREASSGPGSPAARVRRREGAQSGESLQYLRVTHGTDQTGASRSADRVRPQSAADAIEREKFITDYVVFEENRGDED